MKKIFRFGAVVFVVLVLYFGWKNYEKLDLISGFSAKSVASAHFIDQRSLESIESGDNDIPLIDWASNRVDEAQGFASASVYGLKKRKAIYRPGLGAVLTNSEAVPSAAFLAPRRSKKGGDLPFPYGDLEQKDQVFEEIDYQKLAKAVDFAFDAPGQKIKRSRAVLVVYKDHIIAEKYDAGFDKNSKILGWSMTKSITSALFGVLQKQKKINIFDPAPIAEWQNDVRKKITINDLLHMNSGLEWSEDYASISDATTMLFEDTDMSRSQLLKPAEFEPNTHWNYSSGTTNLLSGILRKQFATQQEYLDFWYSALIDKIGMHSMLIETDLSGNYVGSSYGWATARDWAKFGLLYLHNGSWNGESILDPSWVRYAATPAVGSRGDYGAHFWLNAGKRYPDAPLDLYSCNGFQGQKIFIIPSHEMVIVRLGLKENEGLDLNVFLKEILASVVVKKQK